MLRKFIKGLQKLLRMCDLFAISQFIKYKGESDFKTSTGGFCSVAIIVIFAVLFTSMAITTLNKDIIKWSSETTNQFLPSPTTISVSPQPFLFAIGILHIDLNDPTMRLFDFILEEVKTQGLSQTSKNHELIPCTEQHFAITDNLKEYYNKTQGSKWLCPTFGDNFSIAGKFSSNDWTAIRITVKKCDPSLNSSRPCANDTVLQYYRSMMGQFMLEQIFVNPLINPGNDNYLDYYLEDRNFIAFTQKIGAITVARVQDYSITTDESILPYTVTKQETGIIIPDLFQTVSIDVTTDVLSQLYFIKSSSYTTYSRAFYKVDQFFSYVGGLVGVIIGAMFLLNSYCQNVFQFNIAQQLLAKDKEETLSKFNLLYFIVLFFYNLFGKFFNSSWQTLKKLDQTKEQIGKQLDIAFILKRILFLERSIQTIFVNGQFQAMHLNEPPTLAQIKSLRIFYSMKRVMNLQQFQNKRVDFVTNDLSQANISNTTFQPNSYPTLTMQKHDVLDMDSADQDFQDITEQQKEIFKQALKDFQGGLLIGNTRSRKIAQGIKWKIPELEISPKFQVQSQQQIKNERQNKIVLQNQTYSQIMNVNPKNDQSEISQEHFDYITFVQ